MAAGASPAVQEDAQRMPEVLLVCLVHDSAALRARWTELADAALGPLFYALSALQRDSRLLVGGVVYRSAPSADLGTLLRPHASIERIPFLPAPRFCAQIQASLQESDALQPLQLDTPGATECPLADALATSLEMLDARDSPKHIVPFARGALRANSSPVLAKHFVHVLALDQTSDALPMRLTHLRPLTNIEACHDALVAGDLVEQLNQRPVTVATVLSARGGSARARASLARSAQELLCTRSTQEDVDAKQLLGTQWKMPDSVEVLVNGAGVVRALHKDASPSDVPKAKRPRPTDSPMTAAALPTIKADPGLFNKVLLLQQQQSTMLKNLTQIASAQGARSDVGTHLHGQMLEQIRQQLLVQQQAIKTQTEVLRSGKQPNFNAILQALINIDKEAREANIQLGGPSALLGQAKNEPSRAPAPGVASDAKPRSFWQGIIKWGAAGQGDDNMFTLVVASALHLDSIQAALALPWPNLLAISAFVPAAPHMLQQLITSRRVPCALLSLRAFPPNMAIQGAENNEQNYRMLAATLIQNQRAAYIPHGAPNCGLLLAAVGRRSGGAPQLLALVFSTPVPLAQLAAQPTNGATANTRGMISVPQPPSSTPASVPPSNALGPSDALRMQQHPPAPSPQALFPGQIAPSPADPMSQLVNPQAATPPSSSNLQSLLVQQLLGQTQSGSAAPQPPVPQPQLQPTPTNPPWTAEQLRALGFGL